VHPTHAHAPTTAGEEHSKLKPLRNCGVAFYEYCGVTFKKKNKNLLFALVVVSFFRVWSASGLLLHLLAIALLL
jgi:hypothetical protein